MKCDASKEGLGACLEQQLPDQSCVPTSFASRQLNPQEVKYSTSELELLAVVWSTYHFRYYLYGNHFKLITDHKALLSALKNNHANKTYQSGLIRWVDKLLPFDFEVEHLAGKEMGITDYLSRDASGEPEPVSSYDEKLFVASINNFLKACEFIKPKSEKKKPTKSKAKTLKANYTAAVKHSKIKKTANLDINSVHKSRAVETLNNQLHCVNNLIKSLSKAEDFSNDESYSKVAIDLDIASSALQSEQADCTNLKECSDRLTNVRRYFLRAVSVSTVLRLPLIFFHYLC